MEKKEANKTAQQRHRAKLKAQGLKQVLLTVPSNKADEIKRIAETLKKMHLMFDENGERRTAVKTFRDLYENTIVN